MTATNALRRKNGNNVDVTLSAAVSFGDVLVVNGWLGISPEAAASGDTLALNVEDAEFDIILPTSLSLTIGTEVYVTIANITGNTVNTSNGFSTSSGAGKRRLGRCTTNQDGTTGQVRLITTLRNQ